MKLFSKNYISFIICIVITAFIMMNYNPQSPIYTNIEAKLLSITAPIMKATSSSLYFLSDLSNLFATSKANKKLQEKNELLESYFYLYKQMEAENHQLKEALHFSKNITHKYVTAQIIGRSNNSFSQQIIIDGGIKQNIKKGQMVLANNQLIGRVIQASENVAKILLLTDQNSRMPVTALTSKTRFIIAGQTTNYFACKYLNEQPNLEEGELVATSASNPSIIPGIIVGSIFKENNIFYVKPNIDFEKIEFVQILQIEHNE